MKRMFMFTGAVCALVIAVMVQEGQTKQDAKPKDLQIMKVESTHEVYQYMAKLNKELGVQCNYCHDLTDYAADHPKKTTTREMMRMVNDINAKYFNKDGDKQITCWTCHQGAPEIETEM